MGVSPVAAIVAAGLVAGTIDLAAACLINALGPVVILHAIASGVLGKASFRGGLHSAVLGLALQWAMSILIAAIYILAARKIGILRRHWLGFGLLYGAGIYFVMNRIVVPLSNAGMTYRFVPAKFAMDMAAMMLFGAIVARFARAMDKEAA